MSNISLSRNWSQNSISDDIDELERKLNLIFDQLSEDQQEVLLDCLSHQYQVGQSDTEDYFHEIVTSIV